MTKSDLQTLREGMKKVRSRDVSRHSGFGRSLQPLSGAPVLESHLQPLSGAPVLESHLHVRSSPGGSQRGRAGSAWAPES